MAGWILYAGGAGVYHRSVTERIIASTVGSEGNGARLIDFLCKRFTYCSHAQWLAFISEGRLLVDGQSADEYQQLASGQRLEFRPPADLEPAVDTAYSIVYENSRLLVINKPPLLPVHPSGRFFAHTLWYLLKQAIGKVHIVTRLDRETSGLVLVAKDPATARYLQQQQGTNAIHKTYLALVHGGFPADRIAAQGWLVPDRQSTVRKKRRFIPAEGSSYSPGKHPACPAGEPEGLLQGFIPEPGAESCCTLLVGRGSWQTADGLLSLVEAKLLTGRTHQIRATLHSLGFPVVGDKLYGLDEGFFLRFADAALSSDDISRLVLPYQALHCASLDLLDSDGSQLSFSVAAPWSGIVRTA
ncbi:MAG: RluA family pseudouridine synthase [Spirochaetia bacterium]|jgi:23S rRNA-/tRNA-specific pseudouridylate synthase|nr:RluA family pseudouridine synthase [Spirochaetia bacterium]